MTHRSISPYSLSAERLARIDRVLQARYLDTQKLPCAVTLVEHKGKIAHRSALGFMDGRTRPPRARRHAVSHLLDDEADHEGIAFMMLVEEGAVALDEPVHRYIPQWRDLRYFEAGFLRGPFARSAPRACASSICFAIRRAHVRLSAALNVDAAYRKHGLYDEVGENVGLDAMIDGLAKTPLSSPGDAWNYSVSTDVARLSRRQDFQACRSGASYASASSIRSACTTPISMCLPESKASRLAACYAFSPATPMKLVRRSAEIEARA